MLFHLTQHILITFVLNISFDVDHQEVLSTNP